MLTRMQSHFVKGLCLIFLGATNAIIANAQEDGSDPDATESAPESAEPPTDAAPAPLEQAPVPEETAASTPSDGGIFGPFRVGATAAIGFPLLLNYSLDATWDKTVGVSFGGGRFRTKIDKTEIEIFNWDVRGRWFPWQGSFFLGAAFGNQGIVANTEQNLKYKAGDTELKVPTTLRLEVETNYLTPHLGWFKTWRPGFTLGLMEIGYHIPLSSKAELQTAFDDVSASSEEELKNSNEYKKAKKDVEDLAKTFGETAVPYINLIRLGWLF